MEASTGGESSKMVQVQSGSSCITITGGRIDGFRPTRLSDSEVMSDGQEKERESGQ
jgi:hypothetical protein